MFKKLIHSLVDCLFFLVFWTLARLFHGICSDIVQDPLVSHQIKNVFSSISKLLHPLMNKKLNKKITKFKRKIIFLFLHPSFIIEIIESDLKLKQICVNKTRL